jgi:formylglycine-generating enzyme required for sulfatase activity
VLLVIVAAVVAFILLRGYGDDTTGSKEQVAKPAEPESSQQEGESSETVDKTSEEIFQNETFTVSGVTFTMVAVEGGDFMMGCTGEQNGDCDSDESPAHRVKVRSFYMGETEVTQELWEAVMHKNPSKFKGASRPVETVKWDDIQMFIKELNRLTGRTFRLPTEAEWEYAARGGNQSKTANKYSGSNDLGDVAWYEGNSDEGTHSVRKKDPNELGLYDMSGNVWEWCQDVYDKAYYGVSPSEDPQGPSASRESFHVYRGGSWRCKMEYCRVSNRGDEKPTLRFGNLGFRLALVP